jgi:hypothetical protein
MTTPPVTSYRHTQPGTTIRRVMLPGVAIPIGIALLLPEGPGQATGRLVSAGVAILLALTMAALWSLTIQVRGGELEWHFGPGVLRKSVRVADIADVMPTRTRWIEGWGIHLTRRGWLYNVAGSDAVLIRLRDGKQFMLGTDEPERLTEALLSVRPR